MKHALLLSLAFAGCVSDRRVSTKVTHATSMFHADGSNLTYVVDPTSERCFLLVLEAPMLIDCATLARNLPEAAPAITWTASPAPPTPAPAPPGA